MKRRISWLMVITFIVGIVVTIDSPSAPDGITYGPREVINGLLIIIPICWVVLCFAHVGWQLLRGFNRDLNTAARPVMSPQEINARFIAETGRPPTIQEVASIQQMLRNERNDARVNAGLGIAALLLIGHDL